EAVAARCDEGYVLPAVARQLAAALRARRGHYLSVTDPGALAEVMTTDLQEISHDLHLRLIHHPDGIPPAQEHDALLAHWRERSRRTAGGVRRVERLDGDVALLALGPVLAPARFALPALDAALALVADAGGLVLDVRKCVGGDPDTVQHLLGHLVGEEPVRLVDLHGRADGIRQRWTHPVREPRFGPDKPVVVLISARTFSGGEEVAFDLQELGRAVVVGEITRGGANPCIGVAVHPVLELTLPVARAVSPRTGRSWEGTGVVPDVEAVAAEALDIALARL
ncbi:MAG: S41 family peptidase, partial [Phycicoccus sp.]